MSDMIYANIPHAIDTASLLVVKIGGGAGLNLSQCLADLATVAQTRPVVIVHGVSEAMNRLCEARGVAVRTLTSPTGHASRYTDPQTRDLFVEAAENVNQQIVAQLRHTHHLHAVGLTGAMIPIEGERKAAIRAVVDGRVRVIRDDYSGSIRAANPNDVSHVLANGGIPVIPPLATSPDGLLNIDGDRASAAIAAALGAETLIILSNVRGVYRQFGDESSFVAHIPQNQIPTALDSWAQGRMKRKVLGAQEALIGGVQRVMIADGHHQTAPVTMALAGEGTTFTAAEAR